MIEDEILKWQFKQGNSEALRRIYEKYQDYLLTVAISLLNDVNTAEDVLGDVFVSFAQSYKDFRVRGSLKYYLITCVVNRARDHYRSKKRQPMSLEADEAIRSNEKESWEKVISDEQSMILNAALARLSDEQKEAVTLHLLAGMKFKQIANLQNVTVSTVQGRYRYGLDKLRSILNGEIVK
jgi:RNA polymerase sigma factor (sigma-70 family)